MARGQHLLIRELVFKLLHQHLLLCHCVLSIDGDLLLLVMVVAGDRVEEQVSADFLNGLVDLEIEALDGLLVLQFQCSV